MQMRKQELWDAHPQVRLSVKWHSQQQIMGLEEEKLGLSQLSL
jgi:hypothetical protein